MSRARSLAALALCLALPAVSLAQSAAPPAPAPGARANGPSPGMIEPPTLTKADIQKLVALIPELARVTARIKADPSRQAVPPAPGMGPMPVEDIQRIDAVLQKHGYTLPDFFSKVTALVATYFALEPAELEKWLPNESTPGIREILDDPSVPDAKKQEMRKQLEEARQQKDAMRAQLGTFATPENRRVVAPMLQQIHAALEAAAVAGREARDAAAAAAPQRKSEPGAAKEPAPRQ